MLEKAVEELNIDLARGEVAPFVRDQRMLDAWSRELFRSTIEKIVPI
ncbi:MAG: hypothetical protein KAH54_03935 [Candidatus Sabulitectum sp.]|nr:hypothetical protein [Candidatus Sabulitectum sp.]